MSAHNHLSNSGLPELASRAQALHSEIVAARKRGLALAMDAGDVLIQAKKRVPHGGWGAWLAAVGINDRTARLYMQVARGRDDLKTATVAGLREATEWLAARSKGSEIRRSVEAAGAESVCITFALPSASVLFWTFWQHKPGSFFVNWTVANCDSRTGEIDAFSAHAACFKKPTTAAGGIDLLLRLFPSARLEGSEILSDADARADIEFSGFRLASHRWGERLEDAA